MKKVFALMMVAGVFAFASCKKEVSETNTTVIDSTTVETTVVDTVTVKDTVKVVDSTAAPKAH